jgi:biopolymer transport protein ExbD
MNELLLYLLKSTLCMSVLYLVFRTLMRKRTFFQLNRLILLSIVVFSTIIPLVHLPKTIQPAISFQLAPVAKQIDLYNPEFAGEVASTGRGEVVQPAEPTVRQVTIDWFQLLQMIYLSGLFIALLASLSGFLNILILFRKVPVISKGGFRLLIAPNDIPAFSLGKYLFISKSDFETNGEAILTHEQAHVRHGHFYDLLLLELVKIIYWFNPAIYWLIRDLKAIHEFQADDNTLNNGIDATKYQLLIIQKCVGHQKFALANSFNHCQIKNRIVMMNKQKSKKAWRWMAAAFIPMLALLLMAFGRAGENVPEKVNVPEKIIAPPEIVPENQKDQSSRLIEIRKDGNYIDNKLCSLDEIVKKGQAWGNASNDWIHLRIDQSIPYSRIDEIREQLETAKVYHVTQSIVNSDEIIYPAGDVTELAKFTQGKWDDWMKNQLKFINEVKPKDRVYIITYSFVIDKNGKVRDGHVIKGCDNPEMNAAYEKILTQIPDWEPAMRGSAKVSVYKTIGVRAYSPPKK